MIPLNSKRWQHYTHVYGQADDIPALLKQLETLQSTDNYRDEPLFTLWSSLCHQYSVYSASYAAVPHIVYFAQGKSPLLQLHFIELVASIHCYRPKNDLPEELADSYHHAIKEAHTLCLTLVQYDFTDHQLQSLLGAIAVLRDSRELGSMIWEIQEETECEKCGAFTENMGLSFIDPAFKKSPP